MSLFIHFTFDIKEDECICLASVSIQLAKQHGTFSVTKVGEASASLPASTHCATMVPPMLRDRDEYK